MFKDRLKQARKSKGYTQESIAQKIGVKKSTFSGYESGNSEPDMEKLIKIMNILEIDANYLYQDEVASSNGPNFSEKATEMAYAFDQLTPAGKGLVESVMAFASKYHAQRHFEPPHPSMKQIGRYQGVPMYNAKLDGTAEMKDAAIRERSGYTNDAPELVLSIETKEDEYK